MWPVENALPTKLNEQLFPALSKHSLPLKLGHANIYNVANSAVVRQVDFKQSGTPRMTTTKQYDTLNRLRTTVSTAGVNIFSYGYQYNEANQRIRVNLADGAYWLYRYDSLGQVISGKKYFQDNTPVPGQQFEYVFDDIGNRLSTKAGGDSNGANLRSATYTPNLLNQYSSHTVPGGFDVVGLAPVAASVTVNSSAVDYRRGEYYQELISPVNTSVPVWQSVSVATSGGGSASGSVYVPKTPENFSYDTDGNQTVDGRWNYTWDAENRLIRMAANAAVGPQQTIAFTYDAKGRRISKKVWNSLTLTNTTPAAYTRFIYDDWNLLAELDGNNTNAVVRSYVWGSDLSGRMQGAGGVGGLLMINDPTTVVTHFVAYDGNGNVAATVSGSAGITTAIYEYGPFGEVIRSSGTISKTNPYRFSTKYQDNETDLLYYGYRYYSQSTGRWLSRDPIEEQGGLNLYGFVNNNSTTGFDGLGHCDFKLIPARRYPPALWTGFSGLAGPIIKRVDIHMHIENSCCYEVFGDGTLQMGWWALPGAEAHELTHVSIYEYAFQEIKSEVHRYAHICYSKAKLHVIQMRSRHLRKRYGLEPSTKTTRLIMTLTVIISVLRKSEIKRYCGGETLVIEHINCLQNVQI